MKTYTVEYREYWSGEVKKISLPARNKEDAYIKATFGLIPEKEGSVPYSSWVYSVTYNNGNEKFFTNHEGNAY